jgi:hypothetical protein
MLLSSVERAVRNRNSSVVGLLSQLEWFGDGKSVESPPFIIVCGELGYVGH